MSKDDAGQYDAALSVIQKIEDDDYRASATEALILKRVQRQLGYNDPAGPLAMRLRREAYGLDNK